MSNRRRRVPNENIRRDHDSPARAGGDIAGPGGPRDRGSVVIDATDGVLLDDMTVSLVEPARIARGDDVSEVTLTGEPARVAMVLSGRINKRPDRSRVLYMFDEDGAAAIVTELLALASRAGFGDRFMQSVHQRLGVLHDADAVRPVETG